MNQYSPPRFDNGELTTPVLEALQNRYDVVIRLLGTANQTEQWDIWVNGEIVGSISRYRHSDGYTVYKISSDKFRRLVREHLQH